VGTDPQGEIKYVYKKIKNWEGAIRGLGLRRINYFLTITFFSVLDGRNIIIKNSIGARIVICGKLGEICACGINAWVPQH